MTDEEYKQYWSKAGRYFGYPECCIEWFINRIGYDVNEEQEAISNGNGFIACPACAKKVVTKEINFTDLIKNRIHPEPYPYDDIKTFLNYMGRT